MSGNVKLCSQHRIFFSPHHKERREQVSLGNEKDSVYRQMGERHREQMRVKILRLGILEKSTFKKKYSRCVSDKWAVTSETLLGSCQGSLSLSLLAVNLKAMDFNVKGCHIFSKIWTCGDSLSHISLC